MIVIRTREMMPEWANVPINGVSTPCRLFPIGVVEIANPVYEYAVQPMNDPMYEWEPEDAT